MADRNDGDAQEASRNRFDELLSALTDPSPPVAMPAAAQAPAPAPPAGGGDALSLRLLVLQMKAAADQRADLMKLALAVCTSVLPALFAKRGGAEEGTPMMGRLLEAVLTNKSGERLAEAAARQSAELAKAQLDGFAQTQALRDKLMMDAVRERIDAAKESAGGGEGGTDWATIVKEVRMLMAQAGAPAAPTVTADDAEPVEDAPAPMPRLSTRSTRSGGEAAPAAAAPAPAPQRPPPALAVIQHLRTLHKSGQAPPAEVWAQLASVAMMDRALSDAIASGDQVAVATVCRPHVVGRPAILSWLTSPGVEDWVLRVVRDELAPRIVALQQRAKPARARAPALPRAKARPPAAPGRAAKRRKAG